METYRVYKIFCTRLLAKLILLLWACLTFPLQASVWIDFVQEV